MALRVRPTPSSPTTTTTSSSVSEAHNDDIRPEISASPPPLLPPTPSLPQRAISQTLTSTAHLANLLPTGTLLAFQLLTPVFTSNGTCDAATRPLTFILLFLLATSCFLASFTDCVKSTDGRVYYGFATFQGMFLFDYVVTGDENTYSSELPDLRKYKLRFIDWVHAVLSVLVFGAVASRDKNVVSCFYGPVLGHETQEVLDIVPIGIGLLCSLLFVVFPTRRRGIGYPVSMTPAK